MGSRRFERPRTAAVAVLVLVALSAIAAAPGAEAAAAAPDPRRREQWALDRLSFERAWAITQGAGVTVAIVEGPVLSTHPDLAGVPIRTQVIRRGRAGGQPGPPDPHSTAVAGIIAAATNNGEGLSGAAPAVRLLNVDVRDPRLLPGATPANVAAGIRWAARAGADVINLSLAIDDAQTPIRAAVAEAVQRGAVVVAGVGNSGGPSREFGVPKRPNAIQYPSAYPGVIGVTGVDRNLRHADFAQTGRQVDLAAPAVDLLLLGAPPRARYYRGNGTSYATAYVSAAAALVRAVNRGLDSYAVAALLAGTAKDLGPRGRDEIFGAGLVDPAAAVAKARAA